MLKKQQQMFLLKLKAVPLECVRLTVRTQTRIWVARHHVDQDGGVPGTALVFSPEEVEPGTQIEIDGYRGVRIMDGRSWFQARIFDMGINVDRHAIKNDMMERAAAARILPFQYGLSNGTFRAGEVEIGNPKKDSRTIAISRKRRDEMLRRADLIPCLYAPRELQNIGSSILN